MVKKTVSSSYIDNRHRVQPHHANTVGTVHGGNLIKWMDDVAAMSAQRFAEHPCVTARISAIDFDTPVPIGHIARIEAYVFKTGRTSMHVRVRARHEHPHTGDTESINDSCFIFVALDEHGSPVEVPDLVVDDEACKRLRQSALDADLD